MQRTSKSRSESNQVQVSLTLKPAPFDSVNFWSAPRRPPEWLPPLPYRHLIRALRNAARKLIADLNDSELFKHMGDRGTYREKIIAHLLRPFLPQCYGVSSGEVFSADGEQSAQIDIVVFDALFSSVLFGNDSVQLFTAESVFGAIEVKSTLDANELEKACENARRLKVLRREPANLLDTITGETLPCNPYVVFAFGFTGVSAKATTDNLNRRLAKSPAAKLLLPDFVFVADPGYMIARVSSSSKTRSEFTRPGQEFTKYVSVGAGSDALPLFLLTLNVCLNQIRLRPVDYAALWTAFVDEISKGASSTPQSKRKRP
jgi:hypothetical protein